MKQHTYALSIVAMLIATLSIISLALTPEALTCPVGSNEVRAEDESQSRDKVDSLALSHKMPRELLPYETVDTFALRLYYTDDARFSDDCDAHPRQVGRSVYFVIEPWGEVSVKSFMTAEDFVRNIKYLEHMYVEKKAFHPMSGDSVHEPKAPYCYHEEVTGRAFRKLVDKIKEAH